MNLVILFLVSWKRSSHTFVPPCATGCCWHTTLKMILRFCHLLLLFSFLFSPCYPQPFLPINERLFPPCQWSTCYNRICTSTRHSIRWGTQKSSEDPEAGKKRYQRHQDHLQSVRPCDVTLATADSLGCGREGHGVLGLSLAIWYVMWRVIYLCHLGQLEKMGAIWDK